MRILYITYDGLTDPLGQSQILPYLTGLARTGHKITVLSFEKVHAYSVHKNSIHEITQKYDITWVLEKYHAYPKVLSTLHDLSYMKRRAGTLQRQQPFDLVHCRSYLPALIGLWLKNKYGVKYLFDMRGFWADERVEGGIWNLNNPFYKIIYKYFKNKELKLISHAACTISLTQKAKDLIHSWKHIPNQPVKIEVIPCCVDMHHFDPNSVNNEAIFQYRAELGISPDDFILTYLGSIGTWYMLDEMLAFYAQLMERKQPSKFLFISGEAPDHICAKAKKYGIPQDRMVITKAMREQVPALLSLSDVSIFFIKPVYSKMASSPTKLGELLSMGIPIIANSGVGDMDRLFRETECGMLVNSFNEEEYNRVIDQIDTIANLDKSSLRAVADRYISLKDGVKKYDQVYEMITT